MKVSIFVRLKPGVLDVQGKAVERGIATLGISGIQQMRIGRLIEFELEAVSPDQARTTAEELCRELLVNTVMEEYEIKVESR